MTTITEQQTGSEIPTLSTNKTLQTLKAIVDPIGYYRSCFEAHPGVVRVHMSPTLPAQQVLINDPKMLKELIASDSGSKVQAPGSLNGLLAQVVGEESILMLEPQTHKSRRKLLTPPFHGERLKVYGQLIIKLTNQVMGKISPGEVIDARRVMKQITMRVILTAVFGICEGERYQRLEALMHQSLEMRSGPLGNLLLFFPLLRMDAGAWSPGRKLQTLEQDIRQLLFDQIAERRDAINADPLNNQGVDVLSLLLSCRDEQGHGLSDSELHDELQTLLIAGHETTATALTWALYWLHRDPMVLQRVRQELSKTERPIDPEQINRLPYLGAVVNEVLRIHPVAMLMFPRRVEQPITMAGYRFKPGDVLLGCIQALHERDDIFPNPQCFEPERFLAKNFNQNEFMPFGGGARRCIGAALAIYEMKLVLSKILEKFTFELCPESDCEIKPSRRGFTLGPSKPVRLKVKEIGCCQLAAKEVAAQKE